MLRPLDLAFPIVLLAASFNPSPLRGEPWIQQDRWLFLGPIDPFTDCLGDLENNPLPGHDLTRECPAEHGDWGGGSIQFPPNARTAWTSLSTLGLGPGDLVDLGDLAGKLGARDNQAKAVLVTYAVNVAGLPLDVYLCTSSTASIQVWVNDRIVTNVRTCRITECDCSEVSPAVLPPGKNRITVVVWQGFGPWNFRIRLFRPDGSTVDDRYDPEVHFTLDPAGCASPGGAATASRSLEKVNGCPSTSAETRVSIRGDGQGNPEEPVTVSETVLGGARVGGVSDGGAVTPVHRPDACNLPDPSPVGIFSDYRDLGGPCSAGTTSEPQPGIYDLIGSGNDIWQCGDQFQFAYRRLRGDFAITAKVEERDWGGAFPPSRWGKFGIMAREDCSQNSRYAFIRDASPNSDPPAGDFEPDTDPQVIRDPDAAAFAGRSTHHGNDDFESTVVAPAPQHPRYLRLERVGSVFTGSVSEDGKDWTETGVMDWGPGAPCEILGGLAVTSHAGCPLIRIRFTEVVIEGGDAPCTSEEIIGQKIVWSLKRSVLDRGLSYRLEGKGVARVTGNDGRNTIRGEGEITVNTDVPLPVGPDFDASLDIGDAAGGSTSYADGIYRQVGSGHDFWNDGDSSQFAYRSVKGDFDFTVQIVRRGTTDPDDPDPRGRWGRHGLMARKDCSATSKYSLLYEYLGSATYVDPFNSPDWPTFQEREVHHFAATTTTLDLDFNYEAQGQRPDYLKLVRHGSIFYGYLSPDGVSWRPLGSHTWLGQDQEEPILVGFTTQRHDSNQKTPVVEFKVLHLGAPEPAFRSPIPDDGISEGEVVYRISFNDPAEFSRDFQAQHNTFFEGKFDPTVAGGRLRLQEEDVFGNATSAFRKSPLLDIDSAIYQFDFDAFLSYDQGPDDLPPADGLTLTLTGGRDATRVGIAGGTMGYGGLGREPETNANIGNNSFSVEFDTWNSGGFHLNEGAGSPGNPFRYHVGINATNNVNSVTQTSEDLPDIFAPEGLHARVRYNRGRVQVWLGPRAGSEEGLRKYLEADTLPISHLWPDQSAVFGFTAATGAATETGEVDNLVVRRIECNDIPEVASIGGPADPLAPGVVVELDGSSSSPGPGDTGALTYRWEFLSGPGTIEGPADAAQARIRTSSPGTIIVRLTVDDGECANPASAEVTLIVEAPLANWRRCELNADGEQDLSDAIYLLSFLFGGGPDPACIAAADCNVDGGTDISDAVFELAFLFLGGLPPPPPYPGCDHFEDCDITGRCP